MYSVLWQSDDNDFAQELTVENAQQIQPALGSKVVAIVQNGNWRFELYRPEFTARALWQVTHAPQPPFDDLILIGRIHSQNQSLDVLQPSDSSTGQLFAVPSSQEAPLFSRWESNAYQPSPLQDTEVFVQQTFSGASGHVGKRCTLVSSGRVSVGECSSTTEKGLSTLSGVEIVLKANANEYNDSLQSLRRRFLLTPRMNAPIPKHTHETLQVSLDRYLADPVNVNAMVISEGAEVRLHMMQIPDVSGAGWTQIAQAMDTPFVNDGLHSPDATVRLLEDASGSIVASFRQVPAYTLAEWLATQGKDLNELLKPREQLRYAGPETLIPSPGEQEQIANHRFEWGYGKSMLIPEDQLRYNGRSFSQELGLILAYGDSITETIVKFESSRDQAEPSGIDALGKHIFDIQSVQHSQSRSIYEHQRNFSVVHRLHLGFGLDTVNINLVEGFNDSRFEDDSLKSLDRVQATLDANSETRLLERAKASGWFNPEDRAPTTVVLGRLDVDEYINSFGMNVVFKHVRFSFESSEGEECLKSNDRVFLRIERALEFRNDLALRLDAPEDTNKADLGADIFGNRDKILLFRRDFSAKEDRLKQVLQQPGGGVIGKTILASVIKNPRGTRAYLIRRNRALLPPRGISALGSALSGQGDSALATVVGTSGPNVSLEMRPGVYVRLATSQLTPETRVQDLMAGTIVRISRRNLKALVFDINRAVPGQHEYLSHMPRLVTIFPLNTLIQSNVFEAEQNYLTPDQQGFWNRRLFSVGGLPDVLPMPGTLDSRTNVWTSPNPNSFIQFMRQPHPKIAQVALDATGQPRLVPAPAQTPVGRLSFGTPENDPIVHFSNIRGTEPVDVPVPWSQLTFSDEPAATITQRAQDVRRTFHDTYTGHWTTTNEITTSYVKEVTSISGPLIFQGSQEHPRLRYNSNDLARFGLPLEELITQLKSRTSDGWYTVASVSDRGGLWLEIAPGYIVELPAQVMQARLTEKQEFPLEGLWWAAFAPGDKVLLKLSGDPLGVHSITLLRWLSGPRGSFKTARTLLPMISHDAKSGAMKLGAGAFTLTIPSSKQPVEAGEAILLGSDNSVSRSDGVNPSIGDVVLLGTDNQRLFVYGAPGLTPLPDKLNPKLWQDDTLRELILQPDGKFINRQGLMALIRGAQGALPVTIEAVADGRLYFSRRLQRVPRISDESLSMAEVLGKLDWHNVLLRSGAHLFTAALSDVVSGCPVGAAEEIVNQLKHEREHLWFRFDANGKPIFGVRSERNREPSAEARAIIKSKTATNEPQNLGIVCRSVDSQRLYWLPAKLSAWAQLDAQQLSTAFLPRNRNGIPHRFNVRLIENAQRTRIASIIDVREIHQELVHLEAGRQLSIRFISEMDPNEAGESRWIAATLATGILLTCITYDAQIQREEVRTAEVIRRMYGDTPELEVVLTGLKRLHLDLPSSITNPLAMSEDTQSPFQANENTLGDLVRQSGSGNVSLTNLGVQEVERMMMESHGRSWHSIAELQNQLAITRSWIDRHSHESEMSALAGVTAVVTLASAVNKFRTLKDSRSENQNTVAISRQLNRDSRNLLRDIGRRSLRSMHCDLISNLWLAGKLDAAALGPIANRLQPLRGYLEEPVEQDGIAAIQRFHQAVNIRAGTEIYQPLLAVADSLAAAIGELDDITNLIRAERLWLLACLGRSVSSPVSPPYLHERQLAMLDQFLRRAHADHWDVTLLGILPVSSLDASLTPKGSV